MVDVLSLVTHYRKMMGQVVHSLMRTIQSQVLLLIRVSLSHLMLELLTDSRSSPKMSMDNKSPMWFKQLSQIFLQPQQLVLQLILQRLILSR